MTLGAASALLVIVFLLGYAIAAHLEEMEKDK